LEAAPRIHRIDTPLGDRMCSLFVLVGRDLTMLIDTGVAGSIEQYVLPYLSSIGLRPESVRLVLVTHADIDHSGDTAGAKRAFPHALLAAHRDDAAEISSVEELISRRYGQFEAAHGIAESEATNAWFRAAGDAVPIDLALSGGGRIRLGEGWDVHILHTPGHSRGHLTVWDPRSRTAIIADAALWRTLVTTAGAPVFPPTYRYVDAYRGSIAQIAALDPDIVLTSHFPTMTGSAGMAFLAESRAYVDVVEEVVLNAVRASGRVTAREVINIVAPRMGPWPLATAFNALAYPVIGHLERLTFVGALTAGLSADGITTWEASR